MRAAMAAAEVGDDVYGEDPTVNLLEKRAAEIFGREAALFVPTGTMGNQILDWEMATTAVFSGCLVRAVQAERGILMWKHIEPVIFARGSFRAATGLIEIENTANLAGGTCTPLGVLEEIWDGAKERKLPVHLDGARIFNASTALGADVKTLTRTYLPQGAGRRNAAGRRAGCGRTHRAGTGTEEAARGPRQCAVAG